MCIPNFKVSLISLSFIVTNSTNVMESIASGFCWLLGVAATSKSSLKEITLEKISVRFEKRKKKDELKHNYRIHSVKKSVLSLLGYELNIFYEWIQFLLCTNIGHVSSIYNLHPIKRSLSQCNESKISLQKSESETGSIRINIETMNNKFDA